MKIRIVTCKMLALGALGFVAQLRAEPELVNIRAVDPTIAIELRYASTRNSMKRAIYPPDMAPLIRPAVAEKLVAAQTALKPHGFRLKIWDAYRPKEAHEQLWQYLPNTDFVANPQDGGSLHTWGVAVDATLVYANGQPVEMPTDFDEFTPAAMLHYIGNRRSVRENLTLLQGTMGRAGFYGMRTEWWHFVAKDWKNYSAVDLGKTADKATPVPSPSPASAPPKIAPKSNPRPAIVNILASPPPKAAR